MSGERYCDDRRSHPSGGTWVRTCAVAFLAAFGLGGLGCKSRGLPADSYQWNPALARTQGKLDGFVGDLPLGTQKGLIHHHPLDPDDGTIVFTNGDTLLPFVHKHDDAVDLAYATAYYDEDGSVSGAADAELLKPGEHVSLSKKKDYVGDNGAILQAPTATFTFDLRPVQGLLPDGGPCRLYLAESDKAPVLGDDALSFVVLVGEQQNLYLEIVARGTLKSSEPEPADLVQDNDWRWDSSAPAKPFQAVADWSQQPLRKLREANAKTRLGVCTLPQ